MSCVPGNPELCPPSDRLCLGLRNRFYHFYDNSNVLFSSSHVNWVSGVLRLKNTLWDWICFNDRQSYFLPLITTSLRSWEFYYKFLIIMRITVFSAKQVSSVRRPIMIRLFFHWFFFQLLLEPDSMFSLGKKVISSSFSNVSFQVQKCESIN